MRSRSKQLLGLAALITLVWATWTFSNSRERQKQHAKAVDQAVWIARVWNEGMSITDLREKTAEAAGHPLDLSAWETGDGPWIARGPVVGQRRIHVSRDRSVVWEPIVPGNH